MRVEPNYQVIEVVDGQEILAEPGYARRDYKAAQSFARTCYEVRGYYGYTSVHIRDGVDGTLVYKIDADGQEHGLCNCCSQLTVHNDVWRDDDGWYYCEACVVASEDANAADPLYQ
jgi:hypothetical protein